MSTAVPPPPPSAPQPPAKKGFPIWGWLAIGCIGLIFAGVVGFAALGWFAVGKVKEVAADFEENPGRAAAEMVVRLNPDLEKVSEDEAAGTITVREKSSGKVATFDYSDLEEGRLSFETEDGAVTHDVNEAGEGGEGLVTMTTEEGTTTLGGGDLPAWIPRHPDSGEEQVGFQSTGPDGAMGNGAFVVDGDAKEIYAWYQEQLADQGYEVTNTATFGSGTEWTGMVTGASEGRTLTVSCSSRDGATQVGVQYQVEAGG